MSSKKIVLSSAVALASVNAAWSFQAAVRAKTATATSLNMVAVDPTVVTKKEYEDICGVSFDDESLLNEQLGRAGRVHVHCSVECVS